MSMEDRLLQIESGLAATPAVSTAPAAKVLQALQFRQAPQELLTLH
jgi:hypothetical protein